MAAYEGFAWYHGRVDRARAEEMLRQRHTGTYLVRDSSSIPGDFVLSVRENTMQGAMYSHYIINVRSNLYIIGDQTFHSLPEVIDFYRNHYLDTTILTEIAPKERPAQDTVGGSVGNVVGEICRVKALYRFTSSDPEDLEFEKDDIMIVLRKDEDSWWHVRHARTGREGSIPVPYIEVLPQTSSTPAASSRPPFPGPNITSPGITTPPVPHPVAPSAPSVPASSPRQTRALAIMDRIASAYDSTALSFKAGDTIIVIQMNENGLWEGECNGRRGHFPFTHVQVVDDDVNFGFH